MTVATSTYSSESDKTPKPALQGTRRKRRVPELYR